MRGLGSISNRRFHTQGVEIDNEELFGRTSKSLSHSGKDSQVGFTTADV